MYQTKSTDFLHDGAPNRDQSIEDRPPNLSFYGRFVKRAFDLFLAFCALPVVAPVLFIIWGLTKLDGGPGFYMQNRVGRDGRVFRCYKIRTMVVDAETVLKQLCDSDPEIAKEWHENQKLAKDPRITPIGHFLRKTSLDELPQVINVILGHMSFVGPRPFMEDQDHLYRAEGARSEAYYRVRPGITGPWQILGRGQTTFASRAGFDTQYLREMSLIADLVYIFKTVGVVLKARGQ